MANVIIVQDKLSDGTLVAPKIPEEAIYDMEGNNLSDKIIKIKENKGNTIFISKWHIDTESTPTLSVGEIGYNETTNKLYIGKSNNTLGELELKTTNLYCYLGNAYKYNSTIQKLEYINSTTQSSTVGDTDEFSSTKSYTKGDLVEVGGVVYLCTEDSQGDWATTQGNFTVYVMKDEVDGLVTDIDYFSDTVVDIAMNGGDFNQLVSCMISKKYEGQQVMVVKYKKDETPSIANWTAELTKEYGDYDVWSLTNSGTTVIDYRMWQNNQNLIGVLYMPITSKVKYLSFNNCQNLVEVMSSAWDTSGLITLETVFTSCKSLTYLDVSNWDTSNVTSLAQAFHLCQNLTTLNVSNWNTSKVRSFSSLFYGCRVMEHIDVSNWDTSKVTSFNNVFAHCYNLKSVDVSKWDTSKSTNFGAAFYMCKSLESIDVSNWDTSKATELGAMFLNCFKLKTIDVSNWITSGVTNFSYIFDTCISLTSIDVSKWDASKGTGFQAAFLNCSGLTSIDVSNWGMDSAKDLGRMFGGCSNLTSLNTSNWNLSSATTISQMFYGCSSLASVDVSNWDISNVTSFYSTFHGCSNVTTLDMSNWNTGKVSNIQYIFNGCTKVSTLPVGKNFFRVAKQIDISTLPALTRASFGNFANVAKEAYDEGIAGKGDGTVTELREVKLSSTQKTWTTECAVLTSAGYTIV